MSKEQVLLRAETPPGTSWKEKSTSRQPRRNVACAGRPGNGPAMPQPACSVLCPNLRLLLDTAVIRVISLVSVVWKLLQIYQMASGSSDGHLRIVGAIAGVGSGEVSKLGRELLTLMFNASSHVLVGLTKVKKKTFLIAASVGRFLAHLYFSRSLLAMGTARHSDFFPGNFHVLMLVF